MDYTAIRKICIHGASLTKDGYWSHSLWDDVKNPCGKLFEDVFEQYNYVYMVVRDGDGVREVELTRTCCLLTVLRVLNMDLNSGVIDISAKNKVKEEMPDA